MKKYKNSAFPLILIIVFAHVLAGCGESNTISSYIVSDQQYKDRIDLENAKQPEQLKEGKNVYASVYFIESPKGMEYTAKWFINGNEVKTDTQRMTSDKRGVIIFSLEGDQIITGTLKLEVSYDGVTLASKEIVIAVE